MCHQSQLGAKGFSAARARKAFRVARTLHFLRGNTVQSIQNSLAAAVVVFVVAVCSSWQLRLPALLRWCFRADWRRRFPLPHLWLLHPWWMLITPSVKSRDDKMKRLSARSWQGGSHVTRTDQSDEKVLLLLLLFFILVSDSLSSSTIRFNRFILVLINFDQELDEELFEEHRNWTWTFKH